MDLRGPIRLPEEAALDRMRLEAESVDDPGGQSGYR